MGFWDFIAPDKEAFDAVLLPLLPAALSFGKFELSDQDLADIAWSNPASAAGIVTRLLYQNGAIQAGAPAAGQSLVQAQIDNLTRGGLGTLGPTTVGSDLTMGLSMAQIVIANTYRCTVKAVFGGQEVQNTFHFLGSGPGQETACATALQAAWKTAGGPLTRFDTKYVLQEFEAIDLSSISGGIWVIADTTPGTRAVTATAGRQTSALITYNGQTRNRSSRGRTYLGPLYETDISVDGASLESGSVTAIGTAMTNFRTVMTTAGFAQQVLSRTLVQNFPVTFQRVEPIIATQRRRLR